MSEKDKLEFDKDLKDIQKPLLDGHSPQASEQGNDDINIPDYSKVHPRAEDSRSGPTGSFAGATKSET